MSAARRGQPRPPLPLALKDCQLVAEGQIRKLESGLAPQPNSHNHEHKE